MQQLKLRLEGRRRVARELTVVEGFHQVGSRGDFLIEMQGPHRSYTLSSFIPEGFIGEYNGRSAGPYRYRIVVTVEELP
ncbi:MAG: hypothetical protein NUW06_00280 [Candidatus Acetothermia bacterium]|jgi:hypothetical protein|nr:hypothetical protein [Candidatus Acetothermia bacterium]MDH7504950.1 hypothetical protein [Candidatus Acetothermia bacterium]